MSQRRPSHPAAARLKTRLREQIVEYYGEESRTLVTRPSPRFGAALFVVDFTEGARHMRLLGSMGRGGRMLEQSAMDLLHPERLVFFYERLMFLAFAIARQASSALLLGLGGGAMLRHMAAYLPDCRAEIVERDPVIIDLARRFFRIAQPISPGDAETAVADARGLYDVVLVDLYDARGYAAIEPGFWDDCIAALRPGGCLAVNWAEFVDAEHVEPVSARIAAGAPCSFFLGRQDLKENVVQFAAADQDFALGRLDERLKRFAKERGLPREDREVLKRSRLLRHYPYTTRKRRARPGAAPQARS